MSSGEETWALANWPTPTEPPPAADDEGVPGMPPPTLTSLPFTDRDQQVGIAGAEDDHVAAPGFEPRADPLQRRALLGEHVRGQVAVADEAAAEVVAESDVLACARSAGCPASDGATDARQPAQAPYAAHFEPRSPRRARAGRPEGVRRGSSARSCGCPSMRKAGRCWRPEHRQAVGRQISLDHLPRSGSSLPPQR
jgi:hypothetical protein